jgi:hypothetical protein
MTWKTLDDLDLAGRRVLVRVDLNVPLANGVVTDTTRIERIVPTIRKILSSGGRPILLAHFDRPKGKVVPEMSLAQILPALETALGQKVAFAADCVGEEAAAAVAACSRIRGSTPAKKQTTLPLPRGFRPWAMCTATTPSRPPTEPMLRQRASLTSCHPAPGASWQKNSGP